MVDLAIEQRGSVGKLWDYLGVSYILVHHAYSDLQDHDT